MSSRNNNNTVAKKSVSKKTNSNPNDVPRKSVAGSTRARKSVARKSVVRTSKNQSDKGKEEMSWESEEEERQERMDSDSDYEMDTTPDSYDSAEQDDLEVELEAEEMGLMSPGAFEPIDFRSTGNIPDFNGMSELSFQILEGSFRTTPREKKSSTVSGMKRARSPVRATSPVRSPSPVRKSSRVKVRAGDNKSTKTPVVKHAKKPVADSLMVPEVEQKREKRGSEKKRSNGNERVNEKRNEQERRTKTVKVETPQEKIEKIKARITRKDAAIFCRVSTYNQTGGNTVSLEMQEAKCARTCALFELKIMSVSKVVESAYDGKACTIKSLINKNRGKNIVIYSVDRFCRNRERGAALLDFALKCRTRLFFVTEGIVWDGVDQWQTHDKIMDRLKIAEEESAAIGRRIRDAIAEKKRLGFFTGRVAPYGFTIQPVYGGKRLVPNAEEADVIKFIEMCRKIGTSVDSINTWLTGTSEGLIFEYRGAEVSQLMDVLSFSNIADILNDYEVTFRGGLWTGEDVRKVVNRTMEGNVDEMLEDMEKLAFEM